MGRIYRVVLSLDGIGECGDRLDEPEGGIDRIVVVVGDRSSIIGEPVWDQSISDLRGEGSDYRGGYLLLPSDEAESREGDHRIPPPVGEPRVHGDDTLPLTPSDDEGVGRQGSSGAQLTVEWIAPGQISAPDRDLGASSEFITPPPRDLFYRGPLGSEGHGPGLVVLEWSPEEARTIEIFSISETALGLLAVAGLAVPVPIMVPLSPFVCDEEGGDRRIGLVGNYALLHSGGGTDLINFGDQSVEITASDEGPELEGRRSPLETISEN